MQSKMPVRGWNHTSAGRAAGTALGGDKLGRSVSAVDCNK